MVRVTSDSLAAIGYDSPSETLRIKFRNGGLYDYFEVTPEVYEGLLADQPHPWGSWRRHITSAYKYRRVAWRRAGIGERSCVASPGGEQG